MATRTSGKQAAKANVKAAVPAEGEGASGKVRSGADRRRMPRRDILESFSLFVSIPSKGGARLPVHDVSELGIGFDADVEGEGPLVPLAPDSGIEVHFYLNQSLYIPLRVRVVRVIEDRDRGVRKIGAELVEPSESLAALVRMLAHLGDVARVGKSRSSGRQ
jgi:hypothetical protein